MQAGKLPLDSLAKLLDKINVTDSRVVLGAKPGEDAALIDFGDRYLVAKTDPITFATDLIGWYVVQVNANDLAVMGATPRWLMVTLLMPETATSDEVTDTFDQLREACTRLGIALIGGHTEITYGLPRTIAVGAMLGEVPKDRAVLTSGARPGDAIVMTKSIAIEGSAILAREAGDNLRKAGVGVHAIEKAKEFLFSPGISVVTDATIACDVASIHSMHDPTEGGLATGLLEIAKGADVGLTVDADRIPVLPECKEFWDKLGLDPLGLIASGTLLATLAPEDVPKLVDALSQKGIHAQEIGRITPPGEGPKLRTREGLHELPTFARDELARYFAG